MAAAAGRTRPTLLSTEKEGASDLDEAAHGQIRSLKEDLDRRQVRRGCPFPSQTLASDAPATPSGPADRGTHRLAIEETTKIIR